MHAGMHTHTHHTRYLGNSKFPSSFSSLSFSLQSLVFPLFFSLPLESSSFPKKMNQHSSILGRRLL